MEYSRRRAVADGVNVDGDVYRIRTRITDEGSTIEKGDWVGHRDRRTRRQRWEQLDEDFSYDPEDLDRQVVTPSQIRTILSTYRDSLPEIFPGRTEVPKTLIFAKDDAHAEEIVRITREVFSAGDDFCQKITYRTTGRPEELISAFRNSYKPRIAVTVDMIATGTDIKPLEVLIFMRAVRSRVLYEQMLGRGTRVITDTEFQGVTMTPQARKTRFVIVDAVGISEQNLVETSPVDRKRSTSLRNLLNAAAVGAIDDDLLGSLANRLGLMERRLSMAQRQEVAALLDVPDAPERFTTLREVANALMDAVDSDKIQAQAVENGADPESGATEAQLETARHQLVNRAIMPIAASPALRNFLMEREILIDETSQDEVMERGFDNGASERARQLIESFQGFIQENQDKITALQILYNRPTPGRLDFACCAICEPEQAAESDRTAVLTESYGRRTRSWNATG